MTSAPSDTLFFRSISFHRPRFRAALIVVGAVHGNETCGNARHRARGGRDRVGRPADEGGKRHFRPRRQSPRVRARRARGRPQPQPQPRPRGCARDFEDRVANWLCPLLARHDVLLDLHSTRAGRSPSRCWAPHDNAGDLEPFAHEARETRARAAPGRVALRRGMARNVCARRRAARARRPRSALNTDARYGVGTTEYMRSAGATPSRSSAASTRMRRLPRSRIAPSAHARLPRARRGECRRGRGLRGLRLREVVDKAHPGTASAANGRASTASRMGDVIATRHDGTVIAADRDGWIVFPTRRRCPATNGSTSPSPWSASERSVEEEVGDPDGRHHRGEIGEQPVGDRITRPGDADRAEVRAR
jgi:hypothetical protein